MKVPFPSIIALCILSLVACGKPEAELEDDVTLVESETVVTDTTLDEPILREAEEADEVVLESDPDTPVSSAPPTADSGTSTASSRPAVQTPAATTPARQADPPARTEPAPEPVREPEPTTSAPPPAAEPAPAASSKLPKTHTVDQGGVMHAPGSDNPTKRCAACHGKDLQGGKAGVSCFDCHDKTWE